MENICACSVSHHARWWEWVEMRRGTFGIIALVHTCRVLYARKESGVTKFAISAHTTTHQERKHNKLFLFYKHKFSFMCVCVWRLLVEVHFAVTFYLFSLVGVCPHQIWHNRGFNNIVLKYGN